MNKYSFNVAWSDEDESYIALCPEFPGLSGIGDTVEEAIAELQIALDGAIETYQAEGWSLPEPRQQHDYSGKLLVRMPKSLHRRLAQQAEEEAISLNTLVVARLSEVAGFTASLSRIEHVVANIMRVWNTSVTQIVALARSQQAAPVQLVYLVNDRRRYPIEAPSASSHVHYTNFQPPSVSLAPQARELVELE